MKQLRKFALITITFVFCTLLVVGFVEWENPLTIVKLLGGLDNGERAIIVAFYIVTMLGFGMVEMESDDVS